MLTSLHEIIRHRDRQAPRMDKLGAEALNKSLKRAGRKPLHGDRLYYTTLIGDVLMNALYYSLIGKGKKSGAWKRGITLGLAAGIGGVQLPRPLGLNPKYASQTKKTSAMTIGYYLLGGIIAATAMGLLEKEN